MSNLESTSECDEPLGSRISELAISDTADSNEVATTEQGDEQPTNNEAGLTENGNERNRSKEEQTQAREEQTQEIEQNEKEKGGSIDDSGETESNASGSSEPPRAEIIEQMLRQVFDTIGPTLITDYIWRPLDPEEREIRLVSILSAEHDDQPIQCRLVTVSLDCLPRFEAVSYAWGDMQDTKFILLNKLPWKVSSNLVEALRTFRKLQNQTLLWIDGLCINQTSVDEKNYQIPLMSEIYGSADVTRVWLGPLTIQCTLALETLKMLPYSGFAETFAGSGNALQAFVMCQAELFEKRWWQRLWVLQEYILSRKVDLYCGPVAIDRPSLEDGIIALGKEVEKVREIQNSQGSVHEDLNDGASLGFLIHRVLQQPQNLQAMAQLCPGAKAGNISKFIMILSRARGQAVSDDRDRVYGLLGMSPSSLSVSVNYNWPLVEVYTQSAFAIMHGLGTLALFTEASSTGKKDEGSEIPTWVPDWRTPFCPTPGTAEKLAETLCADDCPGHSPCLSLVDGRMLKVRGKIVDEVAEIADGTMPLGDGIRLEKLSKSLPAKQWNKRMYFGAPGCQKWLKRKDGSDEIDLEQYVGTSREELANMILTMSEDHTSRGAWDGMLMTTLIYDIGTKIDSKNGHNPKPRKGLEFPRKVEFIDGARWRSLKTKKDYYGMAPSNVKVGDQIVVLTGGLSLYVLRQTMDNRQGQSFQFVGGCLVPEAAESERIGPESIADHIANRKRECEPWYGDNEESFEDIMLV
jgi:hypothetical protein